MSNAPRAKEGSGAALATRFAPPLGATEINAMARAHMTRPSTLSLLQSRMVLIRDSETT
jgi:hypothetical protein